MNNNHSQKCINILSIIALLTVLLILSWVIFSGYKFYQTFTKPVQGSFSETFIDKSGLKEVKLILEKRK